MGRRGRAGSVSSADSFASTKEKKKHRSEKRSKKDKHDKRKDRAGSLSRSPDRQEKAAVPSTVPAPQAPVAPVAPVTLPTPLAAFAFIPPAENDATVTAQIDALRRQAEAARATLLAASAASAAAQGDDEDDVKDVGSDANDGDVDDDDDEYAKLFDSPTQSNADEGEEDEMVGFSNLLNFAKTVGTAHREVDAPPPPPPPPAAKDSDDDEPEIVDDTLEVGEGGRHAATHTAKPKLLKDFDHCTYEYPPFKRDFFIPPRDVAKLTEEEIKALHLQLDGAKVTGKNIPPPIKTWVGIGLNDEAMNALREYRYECPFAVQSLAIPILMSGRDLLAIAKTGSGKTLAYLLPMLRHVHAQPRCVTGEGPIGLVLVPTHELAEQIFGIVEKLATAMNMVALPAYGGIALRETIGKAKAGCDIVVATPGRLFDLLVSNRGRVMNLRRCTTVVIDEADRMFDEGFSGHVAAFLGQIRPDRQLAMVSSTMPMEVYKMAKRLLHKDYIELSVGGRPSPSSNVKQTVEFFDPLPDDADPATLDPRVKRLLQLLGEGNHKLVLIFVSAKELCDKLYVCLSDRGYHKKVAMLYSSMDQMDRAFALQRFALGDATILIATAVAERGVDIHDLDLVVNYSMPDHYEAYVNRIGRTGRAGRKGTAITFLMRNTADEHMANDLVKGLEQSGNEVPDELKALADQVRQKMKNGLIKHRSNYSKGFGKSKGFTFSSIESRREEKEAARAMGLAEFMSDDEDLDYNSDDGGAVRKRRDPVIFTATDEDLRPTEGGMSSALALVTAPGKNPALDRLYAARQLANNLNAAAEQEAVDSVTSMKQARYDVNDFGDRLRKRIINRKYLDEVSAETDTSITVKGVYKSKTNVHEGKEPLHLEIRGKEDTNITRVFRKFDELIEEITAKANRAGGGGGGGGGVGGGSNGGAGGRKGFDGKKATF